MPLAWYIGYLPFSMELFALYHFMKGLTGFKISLELIPDSDRRLYLSEPSKSSDDTHFYIFIFIPYLL